MNRVKSRSGGRTKIAMKIARNRGITTTCAAFNAAITAITAITVNAAERGGDAGGSVECGNSSVVDMTLSLGRMDGFGAR
jgi:hypothetical protein